jgi:hypothetical protein
MNEGPRTTVAAGHAMLSTRRSAPSLLARSLAALLQCGKRASKKLDAITEMPPAFGNP